VFPVATAGGVVYTGSNFGVLDAWQASTGNHLWSYQAAPGPVDNAIASNIVVSGGVVYFASNDHYVYAVAAQS
jgi:eukaryotic-like serine/threonine-protein kinase